MKLPLSKTIGNQDLGDIFGFIGEVLALQGAQTFRIRAYQSAAVVIAQQPEPLHHLFLSNPDFDKLPGIGPTLNQKLVELFTTGNIKAFQEWVQDIPESVFELTKVPGLGVKRATVLAEKFSLKNAVTAIPDLRAHAEAGDIRDMPGFGEKSELQLLTALSNYTVHKRLPYEEAMLIANQLKKELEKSKDVIKVEVLGSLRRHTPTVGDIDIGAAITDLEKVTLFIRQLPSVKRVVAAGEGLVRVRLQDEHQVDIKFSSLEQWGAFLQHFTGSKEHNIKLREFALRQGKSLSEHGMKVQATNAGKTVSQAFETEEAFYAELGLSWIAPPDRVGGDEILQHKV